MCAKSAAGVSSPPPTPELQALYEQYTLTRKAIDDNLYKAEYNQELTRYDQTPQEPCQPKEPEDPIVARFKGLILDQEEK